MSIIRKMFIKEILEDEGQRYLRNQGRALAKQLHFHSHRLIQERSVSVSADEDLDGKLSISSVAYLRFLDLRKPATKKSGKGKLNKGYQIYNRFAMGHYYSIAFRLQNDFTQEVSARIQESWYKSKK